MKIDDYKQQVKNIKAPDLIITKIKRRHKTDLRFLFSGLIFMIAASVFIASFTLFVPAEISLVSLGFSIILICLCALAFLFYKKVLFFRDLDYELPVLDFLTQAEQKLIFRIHGWSLKKWDTPKILTAFFAIGIDLGATLILLGQYRSVKIIILFNLYFFAIVLIGSLTESKRMKSTHLSLLQTIKAIKSDLLK